MDWIITLWFEKMKVKRSKEDKTKYNKFKVTTKKKKRVKYGQEYVSNYEELLEDMSK